MKKQNRKERKEAFIKAYQEEMRKQGLMDNPKYGEEDVVLNETTIIEVPYSLDEIVIEPVITEENITAEVVENIAKDAKVEENASNIEQDASVQVIEEKGDEEIKQELMEQPTAEKNATVEEEKSVKKRTTKKKEDE